MQADARFLKSSPFSVVKTVVATEGLRGMYRGMLPILASTGVQKTVLFTANAGARRAVENSGMPMLTEAIPGTGGLKPGRTSSWRNPSPSPNPHLKANPSPNPGPSPDPDPEPNPNQASSWAASSPPPRARWSRRRLS